MLQDLFIFEIVKTHVPGLDLEPDFVLKLHNFFILFYFFGERVFWLNGMKPKILVLISIFIRNSLFDSWVVGCLS